MLVSKVLRSFGNVLGAKHTLETEVLTLAGKLERSRISEDLHAFFRNRHDSISAVATKKIAIEVDGPSHFYINSTRYTAYSKLKHRILTRLGYKVIHIPYFEWNKLKCLGEKEEYVLAKLNSPGCETLDR